MAEALLNQLVEDAVSRCGEIADEAGEAASVVDQLGRHLEALKQRLTQEAAGTHRQFQELATRLEQLEGELESRREQAQAGLDALTESAEQARGAASEVLEKVRDGLDGLQSVREQLQATLDGRAQSTQEELNALGERIERTQSALQERLQAASAAIAGLREAVTGAGEELAGSKERMAAAMDSLQSDAKQEVEAYGAAVQEATSSMLQGLQDTANRMLRSHNQAVVALRKKFAEEAVERFEDAVEPLKATLVSLAELCAGEETALLDRSKEIMARAQQATALMEQVAPVLEHAAQLG